MPYQRVRGFKCYYEDRGRKAPLLLLHGAIGSGELHLTPQIEEFSRSYRVIVPDMRGYGKSRPPERDFPLDFYIRDCEDMAALMRKIGACPFFAAGWSDGGIVALWLAVKYPRLVEKLIVWGANSYFSAEDITAYEKSRDTHKWPQHRQKEIAKVYGEPYWREMWGQWCDSAKDIYAAGGRPVRDCLQLISHPTLILHGKKDPLVPSFHPLLLHREIPHAKLKVFPNGRHDIHLTHTAGFNQAVLEFLQDEAVHKLPEKQSSR